MDKGIPMLLCQAAEGIHSFLFRTKALDNPDTGQILMDKSVKVGGFFPVDLPSFVGTRLDIPDTGRHQRKAD